MNITKEMYAPESSPVPIPGARERYSASILLEDLEEDNKSTLTKLFNETTRDDSDISIISYSDSESDSTPTAAQQNSFPKEFEGGSIERGEVQVISVPNTLMPMIYEIIAALVNLNSDIESLCYRSNVWRRGFRDHGVGVSRRLR